MRHVVAFLIAGLTAIFGHGRTAEAFCLEGPLRTTGGAIIRNVPVYLYATSTQTTFLGFPIDQVETNLRAVTNTWWEEGGANVRPYYAGRTTSTSTTGRVLIRTSTSCSTCTASGSNPYACENTFPSNSVRNGSVIWLESPASCMTPYGPWTMTPLTDNDSFRWTVAHELGHSLGINHAHNGPSCPFGGSFDPSVFGVLMGGSHGVHLLPDDASGLQFMYDFRCRRLNRWTPDSTFNSWSGNTSYSSCLKSRPVGSALTFSGATHLGANAPSPHSLVDNFGSLTATQVDPFSDAVFAPAITRGGNPNEMIAIYAKSSDADTSLLACVNTTVAVSMDEGATWWVTIPASSNDSDCVDSGVSVTYDFLTGYYIAAYRSSPHWATFDVNGNKVDEGATSGDNLHAVNTPAIACGLTLVGTNNRCMLLYDRNDANACLAFRRARSFSDGSFTFDSETVQCFAQEFTPALMFREGNTTEPWAMLFKSTDTLFSMVKTYTGSTWTRTRVVVTDPTNWVTSGALAAKYDGSTYAPFAYLARLP